MVDPNNTYTLMQKSYYDNEGITGNMNRENHMGHNNNADYWDILVNDTLDPVFKNKIGLDFGCGCGRNVMNLIERFKKMDGVDISSELIKTCVDNLEKIGYHSDKTEFYVCDGVSLSIFNDNSYDFIMSTIVLQHICVYTIRFNYFKEFYRILKPDGLLSFQMGYGENLINRTAHYYEDYYDAPGTNSTYDVKVDNPEQILADLTKIGFKIVTYFIRPAFKDNYKCWIYIKASKK